MLRVLLLLSVFVIASCCSSNGPSSPELHPQADEYAALSVALSHYYPDSVLLVDETTVRGHGMAQNPDHRAYIKERMSTLLDETIDDLEEKETVTPLDRSAFPGTLHIRFVPRAEIDSLFSQGSLDGWTRFHEEYEGYGGFFETTRVGLNGQRDQALVFIAYFCGSLCGRGAYSLLSRTGEIWEVVDILLIWIS